MTITPLAIIDRMIDNHWKTCDVQDPEDCERCNSLFTLRADMH